MGFEIFGQSLDRTALARLLDGYLAIESAGDAKASIGQMIRGTDSETAKAFSGEVVRFFWSSFLPDLYRRRYGREPLFLLQFCTIRRQAPIPDDEYVNWHLDANFFGFDVPMITAWVPLMDVGVTAPALEFCTADQPNPPAVIRDRWLTAPLNSRRQRMVDDAGMAHIVGEEVRVEPIRLALGDCCVFDQTVLHRTQRLAGASESRIAIEFRVADCDQLPADINPDVLDWILVSWRDGAEGTMRVAVADDLRRERAAAGG